MEDLNNLAKYLKISCGKLVIDPKEEVPVLKAGNGVTVRGVVSVAKHLVRSSKFSHLKGCSVEEKAAIDQWLEYRVTQVDKSLQERDIHTVLKETNCYLQDKTYFIGYNPSIADILLYLGLFHIFRDLNFMDKQKYIHVSRWFSNMQNVFAKDLSKEHLIFQRNKIFIESCH